MRKELAHFHIGESLGGNQDWFLDPLMKLGGCGAVTACDTCIWLAREFGRSGGVLGAEWLYPFDPQNLCRSDFLHFGRMMKPYLRPRAGGINRLDLYIHGFSAYLRGRAESQREGVRSDKQNAEDQAAEGKPLRMLRMDEFSGRRPVDEAWDAVVRQIDRGFPVPMLVLRHQNPEMKDFVWHWFLLIGYSDETEMPECTGVPVSPDVSNSVESCQTNRPKRQAKAVTYGESVWVDFDGLWDTGYEEKGGLVIYRWE